MNAPTFREMHEHAPAPMRKQRRNLLRRHWLTGAFIFGLLGLAAYTGMHFVRAEERLAQVRQTRQDLEARIVDAKAKNQQLKAQLTKVSDDSFMELMAKNMGFAYPNETMYQTESGSKR